VRGLEKELQVAEIAEWRRSDAAECSERSRAKEAVERRAKLLEQTKQIADEQARMERAARLVEDQSQAKRDEQAARAATRKAKRESFAALHEASMTLDKGSSDVLVEAACDGDEATVRDQILLGFDIESVDCDGATALSEASCCGHEGIVELLLSLGADPNTANEHGRTPLYRATFNDHTRIMRRLLEAGAYSEPARWISQSKEAAALLADFGPCEAAEARQRERAERLYEQLHAMREGVWGATAVNVERESKLRRRLMNLAASGTASELRSELSTYVEELSAERGAGGEEAAAAAAAAGTPSVRVSNVCDKHGHPLIGIAAREGNAEVVALLVSEWKRLPKGSVARDVWQVDIDARFEGEWNRESGWSALSVAVSKGHAPVVEVLRAAGANPLVGTSINASAFDIAANQHRERALGAALPALRETLKEVRSTTGQPMLTAKERPLALKYATPHAAAQLKLLQHSSAPRARAQETQAPTAASMGTKQAAPKH
jgi:ankyrin repeat protein